MGKIIGVKLLVCSCLLIASAQDEDSAKQSEIINNNIDQHVPKEQLRHSTEYTYQENHKPIFRNCESYKAEVDEGQDRGTFVTRVEAVDPDPPDRPEGNVTYDIVQQDRPRPSFKINSTTGEVYTNIPFDRDEPARQKELYISVFATDNGRPALADICTFKITINDINDNSPSFDMQEYSAKVPADHKKNSEVMRVFAYDFDDGDNSRLTYSLSNTPADFKEYFRIHNETGVVYLEKELYGKTNSKFTSTVIVQDNGKEPNKATAEISVLVIDSDKKPPRIIASQEEISIFENETDYAKSLVNFTAESNINDKGIVFELVTGKTIQTNKETTFRINPDGDNFASIMLSRPLDYETVTEYQLTVRAQNKDTLYAAVNIIVKVKDVNDEIPTFIELLKGSVVENDVAGAQAMTVRAIDKDGTSPNNQVQYELITHKTFFDIHPDTGLITAKVAFDREQESVYHVTVQAHDMAPSAILPDKTKPNAANQTFQIHIEDQNDNPPVFTKSIYPVFNIPETSNRQKDVIEVKAVDNDTASVIHYSIIDGNIDDAFYIEDTTGRIKVNKQLDFEKIESYNLTVRAFDGAREDTAKVVIHIQNENDERPVFEDYTKDIHVREEMKSDGCIINLKAYDPDIKNRSADQQIVYHVEDKYKSFLNVTKDGCVELIKPLDRDLPHGSPSYQAFVHATDNDGGPNALTRFAEINIILADINDNAPILNETEVVWYENEAEGIIINKLTAIDYDTPENGPPFTFEIPRNASRDIQNKFRIEGNSLLAKVIFDRELQKFYDVPIKIIDNGKPPMSGISNLRVIIGDRNDNKAQNGSSEIFVYKYQDWKAKIEIGRVYVNDLDDWDLPDKLFQPDGLLDGNFELRDDGMILMKSGTPPREYKLSFVVTEQHPPEIERHEVHADVTVTVKDITEEAVLKSGSIRLNGTTIEKFVERDPSTSKSKKDVLQERLSKILNTSLENVDVFTVLPHNNSIDVRFSAHGSPYYAPERLNNKATQEQENLEKKLGVQFVMVNINECFLSNPCPSNSSCSNVLDIKNKPAVVFTNKTSFVGIRAVAVASCECKARRVIECFNGGAPIEDGTACSCPEGAQGPNCEILGVAFTGDGWAMYPTFDSCAHTYITLNVAPQTDNGLIFYVGPLTARHAQLSKDYMALELRNGYIVFKIDLGYGPEEVVSTYKKINDGATHKIKIKINKNNTMTDVLIEVDECPSDCLKWKELKKSDFLNVNGPLQVGGRVDIFSEEDAKIIWENPPSIEGFKGCISNFTYNSYVYNLGAPSDSYHAHAGCNYGVFQAVSFGIDSNFLVAILVCLALLLILLLAVVVHKRKQDNLNEKDMDDTRENIINYEDEGGGEYDTNFDLSVLQNPDEKPPMKDGTYKQGTDVPADIGSFLDDKKRACDKDNLPCDDVRHYGYEGDGNSSGSLSSLASCTDEGDLKFNYLSSFGPRFRKLADMYGDDASEEGSQNGGEESWC